MVKPIPLYLGTAVLLLLQLCAFEILGAAGNPQMKVEHFEGDPSRTRSCTMDELVPPHDAGDISYMWGYDHLVKPAFDCTCTNLKASYHCPHLGTGGYPKWKPQPAEHGDCRPTHRKKLALEPFPPGFRVFFYGNSHLRQVIEGIMCAYGNRIKSKQMTVVDGFSGKEAMVDVDLDRHCRSCIGTRSSMMSMLLNHRCITDGDSADACSCATDESVFEFENGAVVHYHFAHTESPKRMETAVENHGMDLSDFHMVVANNGNKPRMEVSEIIRVARKLQEAEVPLFWLSTYDGFGDVKDWTHKKQVAFLDAGARYFPVNRMVESLTNLTKGVVEGEKYNPHFCMPGPPNEIGVLLLKIAWALYDEKKAAEEGGRARGDNDDDDDGQGSGGVHYRDDDNVSSYAKRL